MIDPPLVLARCSPGCSGTARPRSAPDQIDQFGRGIDSTLSSKTAVQIGGFDGLAEILDEDEFAEHQVRYGYPPEVISHAERAASAMLAAVTSGTEPFGQVCRDWLAKVPGA